MNDAFHAWLARVDGADALETLADLVPGIAVYAVDENQNVVLWSRGAEALTGFAHDDVVGRHCLSASRCVECLSSCGLRDGLSIDGASIEVFHKDGRTVPVHKYARRFVDDDGRFLGGVEVLVPRAATPVVREGGRLPVLSSSDEGVVDFHGILTRNAGLKAVIQTVKNVARTDVTVLVRGASGSGKELFARAIHNESHRKDGPFLAINCAAMSPNLLESELFGHEKGAFTGAVQTHHGLFERADGGTLFLDEVAELPLDLQAKLLRVLEERTFFRVGGTRPITVDVRVISATHRSLRREVSAGRFREDLMYRLRVVPIFLPTLAERRDDVSLLVDHFIARLNARGGRRIERVDPDAMRAILAYPWPGNVRELKNAIEYAYAVATGDALTPQDLPRDLSEPPTTTTATTPASAPLVVRGRPRSRPRTAEEERAAIAAALDESGGNVGLAAQQLGVSRPTFWRMRKKHGL